MGRWRRRRGWELMREVEVEGKVEIEVVEVEIEVVEV